MSVSGRRQARICLTLVCRQVNDIDIGAPARAYLPDTSLSTSHGTTSISGHRWALNVLAIDILNLGKYVAHLALRTQQCRGSFTWGGSSTFLSMFNTHFAE